MKLLHTSEFRTTSDSNAKVDTVERYTFPDGQPYREIAVKVDADMTVDEARRLIVDLQHAVALAEEFDAPEREDVSTADQPKPRVWHKGDDEPVDKPMVTDNEGKRWEWRAQGDKPILSYANQWHCLDDTGHVWWEALVTCYGPLTEVPADSEASS